MASEIAEEDGPGRVDLLRKLQAILMTSGMMLRGSLNFRPTGTVIMYLKYSRKI